MWPLASMASANGSPNFPSPRTPMFINSPSFVHMLRKDREIARDGNLHLRQMQRRPKTLGRVIRGIMFDHDLRQVDHSSESAADGFNPAIITGVQAPVSDQLHPALWYDWEIRRKNAHPSRGSG